ncbi:MAG: mismatch-specific DNA-glycosylase [Deltaproteobacteria bacterium]|nr:mismatch-specific DNA-glycosylase [Deltaproteobacteria bacterium]
MLPDVLAPGLRIVFVGINPGRVSAAAGAHFANPRNCFWRALHRAGLTRRLLAPHEQALLVDDGLGLTNSVARVTRGSGDLRARDFDGALARLERLAWSLRPAWFAFVGKDAFCPLWRPRRTAVLGVQAHRIGGARMFLLPSTSPANAVLSEDEKVRWFTALARATQS